MKTRYRFYLPIAAATLILGIGGNSYAEREPQNCKCSGEWEKQVGLPQHRIVNLVFFDSHDNPTCADQQVPLHAWFGAIVTSVEGSPCSELPWDEPFYRLGETTIEPIVIRFPSGMLPKCSKRLCYVLINEQVVEECFKCSSDASVRVCRIWRQRYPEVCVIIELLEPCPCEPEPEDSENEVPS